MILKRTKVRAMIIEMINTDLLFLVAITCLLIVISKYRAKYAKFYFPSNLARVDEKNG
jgi:hypothetical protein